MKKRWGLLGLAACLAVLGSQPSFAASEVDTSLCSGKTGTADQLIAACTRIAENKKESRKKRAIAYHNRGYTWWHKGKYDKAIADYDAAISLDPKYASAYNDRGIVWDDKGDYDKAIADYGQAIHLDPKFALAYNNRGYAWANKGDYDRAIGDYDQAISLDPNKAETYGNRGNAWQAKGDYDKAIADYDRAIDFDPKLAPAYYNRGAAWKAKGDYDKAIADFDQVISLDPKDADAYRSKGIILLYQREAGAQDNLRKAAALAPTNAYAALWAQIGNWHGGGGDSLAAAAGKLDLSVWPGPLVKLYLGQILNDAALAAAAEGTVDQIRGQVCDAHFYGAELALHRGDPAGATALYKRVVDECPHLSKAWDAARMALRGGK